VCDIGVVYDISCIFFLFWRLPVRESAKIGSGKKNKTLIYKGPRVNRGSPPGSHIFIG
jgi:hypothetical protein